MCVCACVRVCVCDRLDTTRYIGSEYTLMASAWFVCIFVCVCVFVCALCVLVCVSVSAYVCTYIFASLAAKRIKYGKEVLTKEMLPHVGVAAYSETKKAYFLGYMVHRLLLCALGRYASQHTHTHTNKVLFFPLLLVLLLAYLAYHGPHMTSGPPPKRATPRHANTSN